MEHFRVSHFSLRRQACLICQPEPLPKLHLHYPARPGKGHAPPRAGGVSRLSCRREHLKCCSCGTCRSRGRAVYDIGAFEGVMALFFACRPGQVIACEPNPRICHCCVKNMHLNNLDNIQVMNLDNMQVMARGISGSTSTIEMVYEHLMPGVGSG